MILLRRERGPRAREICDTVVGAFAASMILSGVSQMVDQLSKEDLHHQIQAVEALLTDAQMICVSCFAPSSDRT